MQTKESLARFHELDLIPRRDLIEEDVRLGGGSRLMTMRRSLRDFYFYSRGDNQLET